MSEELIGRLSDCITIVNRLEKQLNTNLESFRQCVKGDIYDAYKASNQAAIAQCGRLRRKLSQLQADEQAKLLNGL